MGTAEIEVRYDRGSGCFELPQTENEAVDCKGFDAGEVEKCELKNGHVFVKIRLKNPKPILIRVYNRYSASPVMKVNVKERGGGNPFEGGLTRFMVLGGHRGPIKLVQKHGSHVFKFDLEPESECPPRRIGSPPRLTVRAEREITRRGI